MYKQHLLAGSTVGLAISPLAFANTTLGQAACTADAIARPDLFGAEILDLKVAERHNQTILSDNDAFPANVTVSYCGVNVSYTHPGWNDKINVEIWLPLDSWNGRFQGVGGGGYRTGSGPSSLVVPVNDGYSAAYTDGGHSIESANAASPSNWALLSPGNLNYPLLQDFAAVALADMAILGKTITESYYGRKPDYSYWTGCSTGGRQGLMLAQRYPDLYNGIVALAPAINWDTFLVTEFWVQQFMNELGAYPPPCEIQAFTKAAIAACDKLDGLEDGVISNATACNFDPHSVVGAEFSCESDTAQFTREGALVVEAAWTGPIDPQGKRQWYGLSKDANLSALVQTVPATNNSSAKGIPQMYAPDWIKYFVAKDSDLDIGKLSDEEYFRLLHRSRNEFSSILGTSDPNLSPFKAKGGKMITWHGLADQLIFPNGTVDYYQRILNQIPDAHEFYRIFEAPGVAHCSGGAGAQPVGELEALVRWVEQGVAPDTLAATNVTLHGADPVPGESLPKRKICAWPKEQRYNGGDPLVADSFDCV